jgi:hypothetical protein
MHAKAGLEGLIADAGVAPERVAGPVPDAISFVGHDMLVPATPSSSAAVQFAW